jgi:hypothetical protein
MNFDEYRSCIAQIPFGKRLPTALYVYRGENVSLGEKLDTLVARVALKCGADSRHNVIKFRIDELKISFLSYPGFLRDPHPELRHAITMDLATGKWRETSYSENLNPPILHRKEAFVPAEHSGRPKFEALTRTEEVAGLYEATATIGFKLNWERLLASKRLVIRGHRLRRQDEDVVTKDKSELPVIDRHKTALTRYELSKPVKSLLEYGLLKPATTFFDYGCGQGSDVRGLQALGHAAEGWDPVHRPGAAKREADVVNLGYVVNVIEDPAERLETLVDAFRFSKRLLVVSALINETVEAGRAAPYRDEHISEILRPTGTAAVLGRCTRRHGCAGRAGHLLHLSRSDRAAGLSIGPQSTSDRLDAGGSAAGAGATPQVEVGTALRAAQGVA